MSIGPVEYIAIGFPGNKFSGEIIPALKELQDSGTIRILDLVIISKDANGDTTAVELSEASPEEAAALAVLGIEGQNLLGEEDIEDISGALDPNSTGGVDDLGERLGCPISPSPSATLTASSSPTDGSRRPSSRT